MPLSLSYMLICKQFSFFNIEKSTNFKYTRTNATNLGMHFFSRINYMWKQIRNIYQSPKGLSTHGRALILIQLATISHLFSLKVINKMSQVANFLSFPKNISL